MEEPIAAKEGSSLGSLILEGRYPWNVSFNGQAICSDATKKLKLNDEVCITLLSPDTDKLNELRVYWEKELCKMRFKGKIAKDRIFDDAFEFLLAREKPTPKYDVEKRISSSSIDLESLAQKEFNEDKSGTNGSSISFILEFEDKKLLFLGDSHPSLIEDNLKKTYQNEASIYFDAIKISHHGSNGNTSPSLLNLIESENYLISTNGGQKIKKRRKRGHTHPGMGTLARIICRKFDKERRLIFNYRTKSSSFIDNSDLRKLYNYSVDIPDEEEIKIVNL